MPIPNEKFNPGVISNSNEVKQLIEWLGGRPVPTLEELGERREEPKPRTVYRAEAIPAPPPVVLPPKTSPVKKSAVVPASPVKRPMMKIPTKIAPRR